jgi:hypothetical protein
MDDEKMVKEAATILAEFIIGMIEFFFYPLIGLLLYRVDIMPLFNLPDMTYWQMFGLMLFVRLFFMHYNVSDEGDSE